MNRHLKRCAACAKNARLLYKLEEGWRNQPIPKECDQAKAVFLEKLGALEQPEKLEKREKPARREKRVKPGKPRPTVLRWNPMRWTAAAAVLLIGLSAWLFWPSPTLASSDVIERLIEWNLEISNANAKDRKRLLDDGEANLRKHLEKDNALLSAEDLKIAEDLLENGCWLAANDDPFAEVERMTDMADKLALRADVADKKGNEKDKERCAVCYMRFCDLGVKPVFVRLEQYKVPEMKKGIERGGLEKGGLEKGGFELKKFLEKMKERVPEYSRPDLHKRFEGLGKKGGGLGGKIGGRK
jgi:hypothetical protein